MKKTLPSVLIRRFDGWGVAIFLLTCSAILWRRGYRWGDDDWFLDMVRRLHFDEFLMHRYMTWSPRISIEALIALTIECLWLWRLMVGLTLAVWLWACTKLVTAGSQRSILPLLCLGFFLLDPMVLHWAVWWVTGSYNYLLPAVAALVALMPFIHPPAGRAIFLISIPAALFACFHEQVILLLLGFQLLLLGWLHKNKQLTTLHILQLMLCFLVLFVVLLSPGNKIRYQAELVYMPGFKSLGLIKKLVQGVENFLGHIFLAGNQLVWMWALMLSWLVQQLPVKKNVRLQAGGLLFILTMILLSPWIALYWPDTFFGAGANWLINTSALMPTAKEFFSYSLLDPGNLVGLSYWGRLIFYALIFLSMAFVSYQCLCQASLVRALFSIVMLLAAMLVSAMVGLSPTLYASGQRIFLFSDFLILLVCCILYQAAPVDKTWPWWFWSLVILLAGRGVWLSWVGA
jgi:hypothetical protein